MRDGNDERENYCEMIFLKDYLSENDMSIGRGALSFKLKKI
jgi:hypothetical protein